MSRLATVLSLAVIGLGAPVVADPDLSWFTIDGGGGSSSGGTFSLMGTIGQPDAGATMTGGSFSLNGGFWGAGNPCPADYDGDGFISGDDMTLFVIDFEAGDLRADMDGDGFITGDDFGIFVTLFEVGC